MTIKTTLKTTLRGALLGGGVLMASVIFFTPLAIAHEANTIANLKNCRSILTPSGSESQICKNDLYIDQRFKVSAVTIYNRRHCHANGVCHKHRFINPNHRH